MTRRGFFKLLPLALAAGPAAVMAARENWVYVKELGGELLVEPDFYITQEEWELAIMRARQKGWWLQ